MVILISPADREGLCYVALDSSGTPRVGWLCPLDSWATLDSLSAWSSALDELTDPPGLRLISLRRCCLSEFRRLAETLKN